MSYLQMLYLPGNLFVSIFISFPAAKLYSLSHLWYGAVGALCSIIIGWVVSMATSKLELSIEHINAVNTIYAL